MNRYEGIFIVKPEAEKEELDRLSGLIRQMITKQGGEVTQLDLWGRRQLGHRIHRQIEGQFIYTCFNLEPSGVKELEQSIKLQEEILKAMVSRKGAKDGGSQ